MKQIAWIICRLAAIAYWLVGLAIKYLWYAIPGVFKVIWNPHHAPVALVLMLASFLDYKLYDKLYLGKYNNWLHLIIILAPFIYFYYLGKHKRQIVVNKTITVNIPPKVVQPVQPLRPYQPQVSERPKKGINPQEPYARHMGDDVRNAKEYKKDDDGIYGYI